MSCSAEGDQKNYKFWGWINLVESGEKILGLYNKRLIF